MDAVAEHVVVVTHDDAVEGVDDLTLVPFDVENDPRAVELLDRRVVALEPVVSEGEEGAPDGVEVGDRGRVRVDGLAINVTIAQGEATVTGLPRGEGSGGGPVALPVEQIELNDAKIALVAGSASIKATVNATLAPLDSGAIVGRAAIDAFVLQDKSAAIHAVADLPEWRLTGDEAGLQFAIAGADLALPDHGVAASAIDARVETGPRLSAQLAAALRDEASPARVAPLAVALEAHGEPDALAVTGRAATADEGIAASFAGRHVLSSGRGTMAASANAPMIRPTWASRAPRWTA